MSRAGTRCRLSEETTARRRGPGGGSAAGFLSDFESLGEYSRPEDSAAANLFEVDWILPHGTGRFSAGGGTIDGVPVLPTREGAGARVGTSS